MTAPWACPFPPKAPSQYVTGIVCPSLTTVPVLVAVTLRCINSEPSKSIRSPTINPAGDKPVSLVMSTSPSVLLASGAVMLRWIGLLSGNSSPSEGSPPSIESHRSRIVRLSQCSWGTSYSQVWLCIASMSKGLFPTPERLSQDSVLMMLTICSSPVEFSWL